MKRWTLCFAALSVLCFIGCPTVEQKPQPRIDGEVPTETEVTLQSGVQPTTAAHDEKTTIEAVLAGDLALAETVLKSESTDGLVQYVATVVENRELAQIAIRVKRLGGSLEFDDAGKLVGVDLFECSTTDADIERLSTLTDLTTLVLWGAEITNDGVKHVNKLNKLINLTLVNTEMDDDGLRQLTDLPHLAKLNLQRTTNMTNDGMKHVVATFPNLQYLHILYNNITDEGVAHLKGLSKLKLLDLRGCVVSDDGLAEIKDLPNLKSLKLRSKAISDAGMEHVKQMTKLTALGLEDSSIGDPGLVQLKDLPLEDFNIFRCYAVTDAGLANLEGFTKLKILSVRDTPINGSGLVHIKGATHLRQLDLSETMVNDVALAYLEALPNWRG